MRTRYLIIPTLLALVAAAAWGILHARHVAVQPRDLIWAAALCAISGSIAVYSADAKRGHGIAPLFQAGLIATVMHLIVTIVAAAGIVLANLAGDKRSFLLLIIIFYWVSLVALVRILARFFREESALAMQNQPAKTG